MSGWATWVILDPKQDVNLVIVVVVVIISVKCSEDWSESSTEWLIDYIIVNYLLFSNLPDITQMLAL